MKIPAIITVVIGILEFFAFFYDIITYPIYFIIQKPWSKKAAAEEFRAVKIAEDEHSVTYRSITTKNNLHTMIENETVDTMVKWLEFVTTMYGNKNALGTRQILGEEDELQEDGTNIKKYEMGEYHWITYSELDMLTTDFKTALAEELCSPSGTPIVIYAETRAEWTIAAYGCFKQNIPIVTVYVTLGDDSVAHVINESEVTTIITTNSLLPKFRSILKMTPLVKTIIYIEDSFSSTDTKGFHGVHLVSYAKLLEIGAQLRRSGRNVGREPKPEDIAVIMYTSGSTGTPKGVLLSHGNMAFTIKAFLSVPASLRVKGTFLGYLPLAHVLELLAEATSLTAGVAVAYSSPVTMIDGAAKLKKGVPGDASLVKPQTTACVPLILDRIHKGIKDNVSKSGLVKRILFNFAYGYKLRWSKSGFDTPLLNRIVFKKTAEKLGGSLESMICGGAPLSEATHEMIEICLCTKVLQGYGLTEATAAGTVMDADDMKTGHVGPPIANVDLKLVDWEEGKYTVKDEPFPRGELLIGGGNVAQGYFKKPDATNEVFFEKYGRRWVRTGDIAEVREDGCVRIIDRKKDLVKLQAGEYVALGKIEKELKTCSMIENICVVADPTKNYCVALVVPNQAQLISAASSTKSSYSSLCRSSLAERLVLREIERHSKGKLEAFEVPRRVKLCYEPWTPESGLLTAAFKIRRRTIEEKFQNLINQMYDNADTMISM